MTNATLVRAIHAEPTTISHFAGSAAVDQAPPIEPTQRTQTPRSQTALAMITDRLRQAAMELLTAWRLTGSPGYFDFERRSPTPLRLGAGVSWDTDSFWPLDSSTFR